MPVPIQKSMGNILLPVIFLFNINNPSGTDAHLSLVLMKKTHTNTHTPNGYGLSTGSKIGFTLQH